MTGPQFPRAYKGRKPSYSRKQFETAQALLGKPSEGGLLDFLEAAWRPLDVIGTARRGSSAYRKREFRTDIADARAA